MARELDEKDSSILRKLALSIVVSSAPSGHEFHLSFRRFQPIARDDKDFAERVARLSEEDWAYLTDLILSGREDLGCVPEEDIETILAHIGERVSEKAAERVRRLYHLSGCGML